jgi:hypothetical protein
VANDAAAASSAAALAMAAARGHLHQQLMLLLRVLLVLLLLSLLLMLLLLLSLLLVLGHLSRRGHAGGEASGRQSGGRRAQVLQLLLSAPRKGGQDIFHLEQLGEVGGSGVEEISKQVVHCSSKCTEGGRRRRNNGG